VALVYFVVTGEWHRLRRLHLFAGSLLVLAICAPWYGTWSFEERFEAAPFFGDSGRCALVRHGVAARHAALLEAS